MTAIDRAINLLNEANTFPVGSPDWNYRRRAALTLDQINRGVPACDWTAEPPAQHIKAA